MGDSPKSPVPMVESRALRIRRAILRPSALSVFLLVGFWNVLVTSNSVTQNLQGPGLVRGVLRDLVGANINIQLRFYQLITEMSPYPRTRRTSPSFTSMMTLTGIC